MAIIKLEMATVVPSTTPSFPVFQSQNAVGTQASQDVFQFAPWFSNTPAQTFTVIVQNLVQILKILERLTLVDEPNCSDPVPPNWQEWATLVFNILQAIDNKYYSQLQWSSNLAPSRGWASNNSVSSYTTNLNPQYNDKQTLIRILWIKVYALSVEIKNPSVQPNRHTYAFLTEGLTITPSGSIPVQPDVSSYLSVLLAFIETTLDPKFVSNSKWISIVLDAALSNTTSLASRLPTCVYAYESSANIDQVTATVAQTSEKLTLLVFSVLLYNQIVALASAARKAYTLPFQQASTILPLLVTEAFPLVQALISSYTTLNYQLSINEVQAYVSALTIPSSRDCSFDVQRINGSLVPTLEYQKAVANAILALLNNIDPNTNPYPPPEGPSAAETTAALAAYSDYLSNEFIPKIDTIITSLAPYNAIFSTTLQYDQDLRAVSLQPLPKDPSIYSEK